MPLSLIIVASLEAALLPAEAYAKDWTLLFAAISVCTVAALRFLYAAFIYQTLIAGALAIAIAPRYKLAAVVGLSLALSAHAYSILAGYDKFAGYPPFVAALLVTAAALSLLIWALWRGRFHRSIAALGIVGFAVIHAFNRSLFRADYPTLHYAVLEMSVALLFISLAHGITAVPKPKEPLIIIGIAMSVGLLSLQLMIGDKIARMTPVALYHSLFGHCNAVVHPQAEPPRQGEPPRDPEGTATFARYANLPPLPPDLSLADYNVLLLMSEAVRYDHQIPTIARLADEAFVFERAYAPSSATLISNVSLLSLTFASAARLQGWRNNWSGELLDEAVTAPELFKQAGYHTFWIGHDYHRGFTTNILGLEQGFDTRELFVEASDDDGMTLDQRIADRAISEIQKHDGERFFGWVYFASPHKSYLARYDDMPAATQAERYAHELRYMDAQLTRVLDAVDHENTIVIFTADHGEELGDRGAFSHSTLYEECIRVPLLVKVPAVAAFHDHRPTSTMYVLPWLMQRGPEAMRSAVAERIEREIGPMMKATEGAVLSEIVGRNKMRTVLVYAQDKIHFDYLTALHRVFDLATDPLELRDLYDPAASRSTNLEAKMNAYRATRDTMRNYRFIERKPQLFDFHAKK